MVSHAVEKILARSSGKSHARPGDIIEATFDRMMMHDFSARTLRTVWAEFNFDKIKEPEKVVVVDEHWFSAPDKKTALTLRANREFISNQRIGFYYQGGQGNSHRLMLERGHVWPGALIFGLDSHANAYGVLGALGIGIGALDGAVALASGSLWLLVPYSVLIVLEGHPAKGVTPRDVMQHILRKIGEEPCIYKNVEYAGSYIQGLSVNERLVFTTMSTELGAKSSYIAVDDVTVDYLKQHCPRDFEAPETDPGYSYAETYRFKVEEIEPSVIFPNSVTDTIAVSQIGETPIQQATIGGCTSGFLEDFVLAARILEGRRVDPRVRMYAVPGSTETLEELARLNLLGVFIQAGALLIPPGCGPCQAVNAGYLADGENQISTVPRNYSGRGGSFGSATYLASAATVAASALEGRIADPRKYF